MMKIIKWYVYNVYIIIYIYILYIYIYIWYEIYVYNICIQYTYVYNVFKWKKEVFTTIQRWKNKPPSVGFNETNLQKPAQSYAGSGTLAPLALACIVTDPPHRALSTWCQDFTSRIGLFGGHQLKWGGFPEFSGLPAVDVLLFLTPKEMQHEHQ